MRSSSDRGNATPAQTSSAAGVGLLTHWPSIASALGRDPVVEAEVERLLARMTLEQKAGQMTQPEIRCITPDEVRAPAAVGAHQSTPKE
jgi:beta-glucosidase